MSKRTIKVKDTPKRDKQLSTRSEMMAWIKKPEQKKHFGDEDGTACICFLCDKIDELRVLAMAQSQQIAALQMALAAQVEEKPRGLITIPGRG